VYGQQQTFEKIGEEGAKVLRRSERKSSCGNLLFGGVGEEKNKPIDTSMQTACALRSVLNKKKEKRIDQNGYYNS